MNTLIIIARLCIAIPACLIFAPVMAIITSVAIPFGLLEDYLGRRQKKRVPEIPPAEERPHIPQPAQDALAEAARIERALREEYLREAYAVRVERARVKAQIDAMVLEVERG